MNVDKDKKYEKFKLVKYVTSNAIIVKLPL